MKDMNIKMRHQLSLESLQDEERMMYYELTERDFIITDPVHVILPSDMKEDIIGFTTPLNLT